MSALPIRKTGNSILSSVIAGISKPKLKIKRSDDSDASTVSFEAQAKANFPDNTRAQELEIKLRKGIATRDEIAELREITLRDSDRLTNVLCSRMIDGIFGSRKK